MSKADVLDLVATISNNTASRVNAGRYYDHVMFELARENWFCDARLIPLTRGQQIATLGDDVVNTLGLIYDDTELEEATLRQIEAIDPDWRRRLHYTRSYVKQDVNEKDVELHPAPVTASNPDLGSFGEPFGLDYPTYNLAVFYSYAALEPFQPWYYLELVIALRVLALEHSRESDHTDFEFAKAAQALSELFKGLLA